MNFFGRSKKQKRRAYVPKAERLLQKQAQQSRRRFLQSSGAVVGASSAALFALPAVAASSKVKTLRSYRAPDHTRVVFDLSSHVEHEVFALKEPHRLVVDLQNIASLPDFSALDFSKTPVKSMRYAARGKNGIRVVFDLSQAVSPKSFLLKPQGQYGHRLVVDMHDQAAAMSKPVKKTMSGGKRKIRIAIDAGHGGEDPGAIGRKGTREKDVALAIAKDLKNRLAASKEFEPVLIRTGDYYVKLSKRRKLAQDKYKADVFISLHADAFTNPKARGASVFALSSRGASSAEAAYLAEIENNADKIGGALEETWDEVSDVLADMTLQGTMEHSIYFGDYILDEMKGFAHLHKKRVEQAGFQVLKNPDIVSVLIETGFISNPQEEQNLRNKKYQQKLSKAVVKGLYSYYKNYPMPDTHFLQANTASNANDEWA